MPSAQIKDASGATVTVQALPPVGQATAAASLPVVLASDQAVVQVNKFGATTSRLSYSGAITSATTTPAIAAQGAGLFSYVTDLDLFNAGQTSVLVQLQNSASTVLWQGYVPAGAGLTKSFETPVGGNGQMIANTALSLVTGAGTTNLYANLNGYKSAS